MEQKNSMQQSNTTQHTKQLQKPTHEKHDHKINNKPNTNKQTQQKQP